MKISNIFAIKAPHLWAVRYEDEELNEWRRLFKAWNNQEYLRSFFEAKSSDTKTIRYYNNNKWIKYTIEEAMEITQETAKHMNNDIIKYAGGNDYTLASKFKPLDNRYIKEASEMKSKRYWLRIYAIHEVSDDTDLYVVSGGGIKLVHQMQDCIFLQKELDKLKITQTYLHSL
jgi:hypothetical protein